MPKRRYEQREPTHDWQQIRPLLKDTAQITCIEKGETRISLQMFKTMDDLCKQQRRLKPSSSTTFKCMRKQLRNSLVGMV